MKMTPWKPQMDGLRSLSDSEASFFFNNRVFLPAIVLLIHLSGCMTSVTKPESWSISSSNCASKFHTLSFMTSLFCLCQVWPLPLVERIVYSADHGQPCIPLEMCGLVLNFRSLKTAWIIGPRVNLDKFDRKLLNFFT